MNWLLYKPSKREHDFRTLGTPDISLFEMAEKRSLSELGIGKKSGAKILAIKENDKLVTNPGGGFILQPGQVLIAFGSKEQLNVLNGLLGNLVVAVELLK